MYQKSTIYSPQISRNAVFVLRRMAWGLDKRMTKTLNHTILGLVPKLNHEIVCKACKDRRCSVCPIAAYLGTLNSACCIRSSSRTSRRLSVF